MEETKYKKDFEFQNAEDCFGKRLKYKKTIINGLKQFTD